MRSHRSGADGVVGIAEVLRNALFTRGPILDHPVRSVKGGFATFLLMSRPPLLCQEGSGALTFIHTFLSSRFPGIKETRPVIDSHRPPLQKRIRRKKKAGRQSLSDDWAR